MLAFEQTQNDDPFAFSDSPSDPVAEEWLEIQKTAHVSDDPEFYLQQVLKGYQTEKLAIKNRIDTKLSIQNPPEPQPGHHISFHPTLAKVL